LQPRLHGRAEALLELRLELWVPLAF